MKRFTFLLAVATLIFIGCKKEIKSDNPFFNKWETPFEVPPFEQIMAKHYMPAYLKGFEEQRKEIRAIITNPKEPSFDNTIKMLSYSGDLLNKVGRVFGALNSANTNDSLQAINRELAPILSKHWDDINLNDTLFQRVKSVYDNREKFNLTDEEKKASRGYI